MSLNVSQFSRGARWMATKQSFKSLPQIQGSVNFPSIPVLRRRVDFASFIIPCKPPLLCLESEVWICLLSRAPSAARGNCSNAGGICFTCNTGRACESREIMEGRKVLSASECLLLNSTHELSGNGSFPQNVTSFKNGYKLAHITAKLQKLTFSFHTPAKDNIMRKPIWMFWELSAPACFAVAGLFRVWQCNAGCQHD